MSIETKTQENRDRQLGGFIILGVVLLALFFVIKSEAFPTPRPPAPALVINQLDCITIKVGDKLTAAQFKNTSGRPLDEVNVVFVFKTENSKDVSISRYWLRWAPNEVKELPLQEGIFFEKICLSGNCTQGRFDSTWLGGANTDKRGLDPESKDHPDEQGRKEAQLASFGYTRDSREMLISRQTEKIKRLQDEADAQYKELEGKRSKVKESEEVEQFNKDAGKYAKRLQELRDEQAFLTGLAEMPKNQF